MKNFDVTRGKFKNYLDALKERFNTNEWKEFQSNDLCKEFGVSVILPQILKKEGYYHYENKDSIPMIMLSQKIYTLSEIVAHSKVREYCKLSREKQLKKNKPKKVKANPKQISLEFQSKKPKLTKEYKREGYKNVNIKLSLDFYDEILFECHKKNISVTQWIASKLVDDNKKDTTNYDHTKNIDKLGFYNFVKPVKKRGRPQKNISVVNYTPKEVEAKEPTQISIKDTQPIVGAESKVKSLETIMALFTKDLINKKELEILTNGILSTQF